MIAKGHQDMNGLAPKSSTSGFESGIVSGSVGFFGGTFDPIHNGHIHLALSLLEKHKLSSVIFCPAAVSPFKSVAPPACSPHHRIEMVRRAIEPIPQFQLWDWQGNQPGPSFTIDAIRAFLQQYAVKLHLILGQDSLDGFSEWKEVEELIKIAPPLIGTRAGELPSLESLSQSSRTVIQKGLTEIPLMDISSTHLRRRLRDKLFCGHLIPEKTLKYILEHSLY